MCKICATRTTPPSELIRMRRCCELFPLILHFCDVSCWTPPFEVTRMEALARSSTLPDHVPDLIANWMPPFDLTRMEALPRLTLDNHIPDLYSYANWTQPFELTQMEALPRSTFPITLLTSMRTGRRHLSSLRWRCCPGQPFTSHC
jgi:hypothetical protein